MRHTLAGFLFGAVLAGVSLLGSAMIESLRQPSGPEREQLGLSRNIEFATMHPGLCSMWSRGGANMNHPAGTVLLRIRKAPFSAAPRCA